MAHQLATGLTAQHFDVEVLCSNTRARTQVEITPEGYPVSRAGRWCSLQKTSLAPALVPMLRRAARNADILHIHMPDPMAALAVRCVAPRSQVVVHWHSDVVRQTAALWFYRPLQSWLLERADAIVATSDAYAATSPWLQPWRSKTVTIPIGIDDPWQAGGFEARAAALKSRFPGRSLFFSLGRMTHYKSFDVLIDAAALLPEHCIVIVGGEGPLLEVHRQQVRNRGLQDKIRFVGRIPDGELGAYFSACTAFCLPSTLRAEAFGVVLLEAMSMGKPIVACDIPGSGVPWVNQSGVSGLNVLVGDAYALAQAITTIATDNDLARRLGSGARARFEQQFSGAKMVSETLALYCRLMKTDANIGACPSPATAFTRTDNE